MSGGGEGTGGAVRVKALAPGPYQGRALVVCVDFGSTFTKVAVVDEVAAELVAVASHPTTLPQVGAADVLDGLRAALAGLRGVLPGADLSRVLACSSAGGGLRLAVVGYERVITAEAGYRVGLSAGARVEHVSAGPLEESGLAALGAAAPDVVLLVGGTDGGNAQVLEHNARMLAAGGPRVPVVVAGNAAVREQVCAVLAAGGLAVSAAANVLPSIGVLAPESARVAIREVFIRHVIGGKGLSASPEFAAMVRAATPDAVLHAVELLADGAGSVRGVGDVVVVDVGGATTDVYSVVTPDAEPAGLRREVVQTLWRSRTVEGDLGMRWNAPGVVAAAEAERLVSAAEAAGELGAAAGVRAGDPGWLPASGADGVVEAAVDARLAALAATVALRRHARAATVVGPDGVPVRSGGRDLRQVRLVVGSGGVFRHADADRLTVALRAPLADTGGGWLVPEQAALAVDRHYVLAAAGLIGWRSPQVACALLRRYLRTLD